MSTEIRTFLVVRTDTYIGNVDSYLSGLLFGLDDDRYGCEFGIAQFNESFSEVPEDILIWNHPDSEWRHAYSLETLDNRSKRNGDLSFYVEDCEELRAHAKALKEKYEGKLVGHEEVGWFTILGFAIVTDSITTIRTVEDI